MLVEVTGARTLGAEQTTARMGKRSPEQGNAAGSKRRKLCPTSVSVDVWVLERLGDTP